MTLKGTAYLRWMGFGSGLAFAFFDLLPFLAVNVREGFDLAGVTMGFGYKSADTFHFGALVKIVILRDIFTTISGILERLCLANKTQFF